MKFLIQIFLLLTANSIFGQRPNTKNMFYNLPLDSNANRLQNMLVLDTLNFQTKMVGTWRHNAHTKILYFYPKSNNTVFGITPEYIYLKLDSTKKPLDTNMRVGLTLFINFKKTLKRKEANDLYKKIIECLKTEYDSIGSSYMEGSVSQEKFSGSKTNYKQWTVYEHTTLLYEKSFSTKEKLSIAWFDERKHGQTIFLSYRLN